MKNLLFISIAFPPKLDPECVQAAKYFKYLVKLPNKYSIDVLTSMRPTLFMPEDSSLSSYAKGYRQLIEIKIWENKYLNFLYNLISPTFLQLPDSKFTFYWQWKNAVRSLNIKPDIIYSRSYPVSSTLMAYRLKKHFNVPWVMHLSDPWVESPLHNYTPRARKNNSKWEKKCFSNANYICFTSIGTIALYSNKYPEYKNKFKLFPNVYDVTYFSQKRVSFSGKLRFVYTGGLAGNRSPEPILKAIQNLRQTAPEILTRCEFIFSGDIDKKNKEIFSKYIDDSVSHTGHISYNESIDLQNSAHVLLVIDSPIKNNSQAIFFPSKLLDYLAAGKKIFAITTSNSTTETFLKEHDLGISIEHKNTLAIVKHIKECVHQFEDQDSEFFIKNKTVERYEAQVNVKRLDSLFDEI